MKKKLKKGRLIWITGLSGSGKTQIANKLKTILFKQDNKFIVINGDDLRNIFNLKKYDRNSRINYAKSYCKFCKKLTDQGVNVIFTAVAMFEDIRKWNRKNITNYFEIFIKVSLDKIKSKNKKNLYKSKKINVVGKDIKPEYPKNPDLILNNNYKKNFDFLVKKIIKNLHLIN